MEKIKETFNKTKTKKERKPLFNKRQKVQEEIIETEFVRDHEDVAYTNDYRSNDNTETEYIKKKKRINLKKVIPIVILSIVVVVVVFKSIGPLKKLLSTPKKEKATIETNIDNQTIVDNEDITKTETSHTINTFENRKILTYNKDEIRIYDNNENLLNSLALKDIEVNVEAITEKKSEEIRRKIISKTNELTTVISSETKTKEITSEINKLSEELNKEIEKENKEKKVDVVEDKSLVKKIQSNLPAFKIGDELLIISSVDSMQTIRTKEKGDISSVYVTPDSIYMAKDNLIKIIDIHTNEAKEIKIEGKVNNIIVDDNNLFYSKNTKIYKSNIDGSEVTSIDLGDNTENMFIKDSFLYVINDFGKGKDNSILARINKETLYTEDIMELKGKRSKFVSLSGDILQIEQMESVKTIDLQSFKPMKSYKKLNKGANGFVMNKYIYEFIDNGLSKTNMENKMNEPSSMEYIDGFILIY